MLNPLLTYYLFPEQYCLKYWKFIPIYSFILFLEYETIFIISLNC